MADYPFKLINYIVGCEHQIQIPRGPSARQQPLQKYIDECTISGDCWGSDKEILAFATMLQTDIYMSNLSSCGNTRV